jgi:outer membrane murein-binding lipoprotein Lpp
VHKIDEAKVKQLEEVVDMLRSVVAQLQLDVHTLKSQQYLRDWSINGK